MHLSVDVIDGTISFTFVAILLSNVLPIIVAQLATPLQRRDCVILSLNNGEMLHGVVTKHDSNRLLIQYQPHLYAKAKGQRYEQRLIFVQDIASVSICPERRSRFDITDFALTDRMNKYSEAYVKALGAIAGCSESEPSLDRQCIDLQLTSNYIGASRRNPAISIQLKAQQFDPLLTKQFVHVSLSMRCYDELRSELVEPCLVVVVLVPKDIDMWAKLSTAEMILRFRAYYINLRGEPNKSGQTRVVKIPTWRKLSPYVITCMFKRIGDSGQL